MSDYRVAEKIKEGHELLDQYSPLISQLLINRELDTIQKAETFIAPEYRPHDPFLMYNMQKTIERIHAVIENKEHITIYADYDADGIPGAVVLATLFDKIGYENYDIYIPHRHDEGYGVHVGALEKIHAAGSSLVITIDVGITAFEAGVWCQQHNLDLIITDHHLPKKNVSGKEELPLCFAVVNPKQEQCSYPDPMLCGAGVIFKVVEAFVQRYGEDYQIHLGWEKWLLDLVGIATISDMVPLVDENRSFAYYGLSVLKKTKRPGLKKLMWDAGISIQHLNAENIGFGISPHINAASRMSHPNDALAMFRAKNQSEAAATVTKLVTLNKERKKLVAQTMKKAYQKLEKRKIDSVIVVGSPDWKLGILGLVASKLVEKYKCPAFVWAEENGEIKGSCRTWNDIHLVELMSSVPKESFIQFGGHAEAGGFSCAKNEIHYLEERLRKQINQQTTKNTKDKNPHVIDAVLDVNDVNLEKYHDIQKLAPFGMKNEKPLFAFEKCLIREISSFGKTKNHLELHLENSAGKPLRAIAFFKSADDFSHTPRAGKSCTLVGTLEHSVFMGREEMRIHLVDIFDRPIEN